VREGLGKLVVEDSSDNRGWGWMDSGDELPGKGLVTLETVVENSW